MKSVLVTGSNGGIGSAICRILQNEGYFVIGTDLGSDTNNLNGFIQFDLRQLAVNESSRGEFETLLSKSISDTRFTALINNAAIQILSSLENISLDDFRKTMDINLVAPLALAKIAFPALSIHKGSIVNIGSIHSKLTKPGFVSYATSKSALLGLTQSLAVDCGDRIRVNAIQPAATATEMLLDGFKNNREAFEKLKSFHPSNRIAEPVEIAETIAFIISERCPFLNGTIVDLNGGIGARLHDPI